MARNDPHPQVCSTVDVMTRTSVACLVGTRATFVKITKPGKKRSLVLCQVEIYGLPGTYRRIVTACRLAIIELP